MNQFIRINKQLYGWVLFLFLWTTNGWAQVSLPGSGTYTETFDALGSGLPTGWTVRTGASTSTLGTTTSVASGTFSWAATNGNFRNVASGDIGLSANAAAQSAATDRALGVRQTGALGDPGAAFVLQLANTTGLQNLAASFKLQSLDASSGRTTTWTLDYGIGASPTTFTPLATGTTGNTATSNNTITANFGSALNNQPGPIWIRVVTLTASTGSGNRPTSAIDDFQLTYSATAGGPTLTATPNTLGVLTTTEGTPSAPQTYTLSGSNLSANVVVQAPAGAEVSQSGGSGFASSLTVSAPGTLSPTPIFVRLTGATPGAFGGSVTNVSGSAQATVDFSGVVSATSTAPTPISTARGLTGQTVTVQGRVTSTTYVGSRIFYVQDNTGGIAVFSPNSGPNFANQVQLGDLVTVTGSVLVFSGMTEISITTLAIDGSAGRSVPTPPLVPLNQLANYQGQLVQVDNTTIGNTTGGSASPFFAAGTNYNITQAGTSGVLRINSGSELPGAGKPSGPTSITGIVDRFVSGATTPGTNGIQLQPRLLTDVQGATTPTDQICGGTGNTGLTPAQTFDITTWNVEFFGADGGTVTCTTAPTSRPYDDLGPTDEARQARNVKTVLERLGSDIFVLEEVSDAARLSQVVSQSIGGYTLQCSDRYSYYWQADCEQNPVFLPNVLAQKVCIVYKNSTVTPVPGETKALLADQYGYGPNGPASSSTNNWASGRLPYLFVADVTTNGVTRRVHVVGLHAKSGSASDDYQRRRQDYIDLKNKLQADYPSANIIVAGDFNDGAVTSITSGSPSSFNTFVTDPGNFSVLTASLEQQGCQTFESGSFLDHLVISNELYPALIPNSVNVQVPTIGIEGGYSSNTTSDHRPVSARFDLALLAPPTSATGGTLTLLTPTYNCTTGDITFNTSGGDGTTITYTAIGVQRSSVTSPNGVVEPGLRADPKPLNIVASQGGTTVSIAFDFAGYCANPPSSTTTTPPTNTTCGSPASTLGQTLRVSRVTDVNCQTGTFRILTEGGNGQAVSYADNVGLSNDDPNNCVRRLDGPDLIRAVNNSNSDVQPFQLRVTQNGVQSAPFTFNFKEACTGTARVASSEAIAELGVTVLGNPTQSESVEVLVSNPAGERVELRVTNSRGQLMQSVANESGATTVRERVSLGRSAGVYLLQVNTPTRTKTVKIVRQ